MQDALEFYRRKQIEIEEGVEKNEELRALQAPKNQIKQDIEAQQERINQKIKELSDLSDCFIKKIEKELVMRGGDIAKPSRSDKRRALASASLLENEQYKELKVKLEGELQPLRDEKNGLQLKIKLLSKHELEILRTYQNQKERLAQEEQEVRQSHQMRQDEVDQKKAEALQMLQKEQNENMDRLSKIYKEKCARLNQQKETKIRNLKIDFDKKERDACEPYSAEAIQLDFEKKPGFSGGKRTKSVFS